MASREQILEKLKNLLQRTTANGASEAEVETAMKIARKLMDQHQIEQSELLDVAKPGQLEIVERQSVPAAKLDVWMRGVASCVAKITNTRWYSREDYARKPNGELKTTPKGKFSKVISVWFYGTSTEVDCAIQLYSEYLTVFRTMATIKMGGWKQECYHYMQGFGAGILSKLNEQAEEEAKKHQNNTTSMILSRDREMHEFAANKGLVARRQKSLRKTNETSAAYGQGRSDGREYGTGTGRLGESQRKRIS